MFRWPTFLPVALTPLWQLSQLSLMPAWEKLATCQPFVVWQRSQDSKVTIWDADFPVALTPLWQVSQVPLTTLEWSKKTSSQLWVI
ncbi:MAG: hypothetical protein DBP02_16565 [gamma proteobacterium symbiont of Ctena orbiculata]|nr:MAG: hypothetical protein DBP02_16565 [gamma proteobacterium symbiont of Ctena orbiculata]